MCNEPFWLTIEQAESLHDKLAYDVYFKKYQDQDSAKQIEDHEEAKRRAVEIEKQKSLAKKKSDYFSQCADLGMPKAKIEAAWDKYMRTGKA